MFGHNDQSEARNANCQKGLNHNQICLCLCVLGCSPTHTHIGGDPLSHFKYFWKRFFFIVSNLQYFMYSLIILHMFTILYFFLCKHAKYQASFCISSELKTTKFEVNIKKTTWELEPPLHPLNTSAKFALLWFSPQLYSQVIPSDPALTCHRASGCCYCHSPVRPFFVVWRDI